MSVQHWMCGLLVAFCVAGSAQAAGRIRLDLGSMPTDGQKLVRAEVMNSGGSGRSGDAVYQGSVESIAAGGIELPVGTYTVYLEHQTTGLIQAYDNGGAGYVVADGQTVTVPGTWRHRPGTSS